MLPNVIPLEIFLEMMRNLYLETLELNNPPNKAELIEQINQAKTTKEMHKLILPLKMEPAQVTWEWDWENDKLKETKNK